MHAPFLTQKTVPSRPSWLPYRLPELDGLRGLAVLAVFFYHCHPRLVGTPVHYASLWGWAGVGLFFVLSGFLITGILLESYERPHYFRNFYGHRALRIWPLYLLVLAVVYLNSPWFVGPTVGQAILSAPWWAYLLMVQNLFALGLPPALGITWSLAIENQYYLAWAPFVRLMRRSWFRTWMLALPLLAALITSPLMRRSHHSWITPVHSLTHLDGIAYGSLLALALYTLRLSRRAWIAIGAAMLVIGIGFAATIAGGTAWLDSALTTAFTGAVLTAISFTGAKNPISWLLRRGPLPFYGRISYGLYMIHISVFIFYGWFDKQMDAHGIPGNLAIVGLRLAISTIAATALWYGFESRILKLKRYMPSR